MFDHDVTMELIRRAQQGDEQAKTRLIEENTPLLKSMIRRYVGKGVEYDDLFQISSVGLLKAINNFSLEYNVKFSTYAVPMVLGEVKRFLRDDGYVKVSRSVKTQANKINQWVEASQDSSERAVGGGNRGGVRVGYKRSRFYYGFHENSRFSV